MIKDLFWFYNFANKERLTAETVPNRERLGEEATPPLRSRRAPPRHLGFSTTLLLRVRI